MTTITHRVHTYIVDTDRQIDTRTLLLFLPFSPPPFSRFISPLLSTLLPTRLYHFLSPCLSPSPSHLAEVVEELPAVDLGDLLGAAEDLGRLDARILQRTHESRVEGGGDGRARHRLLCRLLHCHLARPLVARFVEDLVHEVPFTRGDRGAVGPRDDILGGGEEDRRRREEGGGGRREERGGRRREEEGGRIERGSDWKGREGREQQQVCTTDVRMVLHNGLQSLSLSLFSFFSLLPRPSWRE